MSVRGNWRVGGGGERCCFHCTQITLAWSNELPLTPLLPAEVVASGRHAVAGQILNCMRGPAPQSAHEQMNSTSMFSHLDMIKAMMRDFNGGCLMLTFLCYCQVCGNDSFLSKKN